VRGLTQPGWFEYHGEIYDVAPIKMTPTPERPVPILIGGHAEAALKRAAVLGDGWMHGGGDPYGADTPPAPPDWEDEATRREHELEGGGAERERSTS